MFNKFNQKAKEEKSYAEMIPRIHHRLMKEYGWIPFEEFKKLPITTVFSLLEQIEEENKEIESLQKQSRGR